MILKEKSLKQFDDRPVCGPNAHLSGKHGHDLADGRWETGQVGSKSGLGKDQRPLM